MALVTPSVTPLDPANAGGVVVYTSATGATFRSYICKRNLLSQAAQEAAHVTGQLIAAWSSTLTPTERGLWDTAAASTTYSNRNPQDVTPTGQQLFIATNRLIVLDGQPMVTTPP